MSGERVIAWDFDGVLNANIRDGRFIWADGFEAWTGQSLDVFKDHVFAHDFRSVITGREDLLDRVQSWADAVGYRAGAEALIDQWFARDFHPDHAVLALIDRLRAAGVRQVAATNNEWRRAALIEGHAEFGPRLERVFASGPMGHCKPDPTFFGAVCAQLGAAPEQMVLVDDLAENVDAAAGCGWFAIHLTEATRPVLADRLAELCSVAA